MATILIEDKKGVIVYSKDPLTKGNVQITDIFVTFDDNSDNYANYVAEEDTIQDAGFNIKATGNKNDSGEDEYAIPDISLKLTQPEEGSDSDPDDYESLCSSLWTEPISFRYAIDFNDSGDASDYESFPELSLLDKDD
ncbi:hypothetical protein [Vulcanococcus sp. Clear-D1]|uniref:hypothetical protein n=1 Tax=Vulcanococcus sp. Clear-D1 TaxID=2766970 RepID=UPI001993C6F6|nr:hypothetical protein [Vulcanococcus sp. Clear-D1]MBD1194451.1 hypothetical protein [Vulcanococcus sp. Clear-D1]